METKIKTYTIAKGKNAGQLMPYIAVVYNDKNGVERDAVGFGLKKAQTIIEHMEAIKKKAAELQKMQSEFVQPTPAQMPVAKTVPQPLPLPKFYIAPAQQVADIARLL